MKGVTPFLENLVHAASSLEDFEAEFGAREEELARLVEGVGDLVSLDLDDEVYGEEMRSYLEQVVQRIGDAADGWQQEISTQLSQTEFISKFDQSVIVMAYGKVNCGKSTLGNATAGLIFDGVEPNPYEGFEAEFEVHEDADGELRTSPLENGFPTDGTECTKEIQTFTLGGLTWVDTPGIHSMTRVNQALAKRYVDSAELVLYLSDSDSPGRASDIAELEELLQARKPVLIGITKCDEVDTDVDLDTGQIVETLGPKSEERKQEQRQWVEEQIDKAGVDEILRDREYYFVSARLAREALVEGDTERWEASGFPAFLDRLGALLSDEALSLKQENPKRKLNNMIHKIWGIKRDSHGALTLANLKGELEDRVEYIDEKRGELEDLGDEIVRRTKNRVAPKIELVIQKHAREMEEQIDDGEDSAPASSSLSTKGSVKEIEKIVAEAFQKEFQRAVARKLRDVMKNVDAVRFGEKLDIPPLEVLTEKVEVDQDAKWGGIGGAGAGAAGAWGGFKAGAYLGTLVGGPLGTTIGGAIGALVGGTLAGKAGQKVGRKAAGSKTVEMVTGVNAEEVIDKTFDQVDTQLRKAVDEQLRSMSKAYLWPIRQSLQAGVDGLERIEGQILALRYTDVDERARGIEMDETQTRR